MLLFDEYDTVPYLATLLLLLKGLGNSVGRMSWPLQKMFGLSTPWRGDVSLFGHNLLRFGIPESAQNRTQRQQCF